MDKTFNLIPYKQIGELVLGMERATVKSLCGTCISTCMYGYPVEDGYLDDFGYMQTMCNSKQILEAVNLLPFLSQEEIFIEYQGSVICLSADKEEVIERFAEITDDLTLDDDEEGYSSIELGVRIYCPEDEIESVLIHDSYYYENEKKSIEAALL